jgi:aminoglycoside phosphotransferase (APT) family kinase protein
MQWCADAAVPLDGEPVATPIAGGRSNLTYMIRDESGVRYVLRRPPRGVLLASAHDMGREYRILTALAGTDVPLPRTWGLCVDPTVLGAPFYVMDIVPGTVLAEREDGIAYPGPARPIASRQLVEVLSRIHRLDLEAVGLAELSRKHGYAERQLRRWRTQLDASRTRDLPLLDVVHRDLESSIPEQRAIGLVHGDYRFGNVLVSPTGQVQGVLDWELATLGDTLADLGWMLASWAEPGEYEVLGTPTTAGGFLTRGEVLDVYSDLTGQDVSGIAWYQAFALWRLACIGEGIYRRYSTGAMEDDGFDVAAQGERVIAIAEAAHELMRAG